MTCDLSENFKKYAAGSDKVLEVFSTHLCKLVISRGYLDRFGEYYTETEYCSLLT